MSELIGVICVLMSAVLFSMKAIFVKLAYRYHPDPLALLTLRMAFSFPFFLGTLIFMRSHTPQKISRVDYLKVVVLGVIGYYCASIWSFEGLKYISAGLERLILFLYPTFVVLLTAVLYKKRIDIRTWQALVVTYLGFMIVFFDGGLVHQQNLMLGTVYVLLSALAYAFYLTAGGELIPKFGPARFTSYCLIVSTLAVCLHHLMFAERSIFSYRSEFYLYGLLLGLVSTVLPTFLVAEGIQRIGSSKMAIISTIGPVSTIALGCIFLDEQVGQMQLIAGAIIIIGVMLVSIKPGVAASDRKG